MEGSEISLKNFSKQEDENLYTAYRQLKYQVFVKELGWHSLADKTGAKIAIEDPFDLHGHFIIAQTKKGLPIGVVRGVAIKDCFPHQNLFEKHFVRPEVNQMSSQICTINALAVLPTYRGKIFRVAGRQWQGSIAKLLTLSMLRYYQQKNLRAAIATTEGLAGARFFLRLGFLIIDRPRVTKLHTDPLTNVALIFGSVNHLSIQKECKMKCTSYDGNDNKSNLLKKYFESCHKSILKSQQLEDLFQD